MPIEEKDIVVSLTLMRKSDNLSDVTDILVPYSHIVNKTRDQLRKFFREESHKALDLILDKNINKYLNL